MDYKDMDEETREKRKREQVAYRTKKHNSVRFMILSSVFEIIETVLIMFVLFILTAVVFFKILKVDPSSNVAGTIFMVVLVVIFIGGMILGFIIYKKCARWCIKKFKMFDKLNDDVLIHYFKEEELGLEDGRLK
ncbi:MAG: hypothetical protein MJ185_05135 [Treponema sp.]|nr:hypothetical protein [Treponema sp.]